MLFDLKGKRRRVVQGVYLSLAILMGGGLVLFGIGSDVSGGLGDLFTGGGGGENQAEETAQKRVDAAEKTLQTDPQNQAALAQLVRSHYQLATSDVSETGQFSSKAIPELEATADAWERYVEAAKKVDPALGRFAIQAYEGLATAEEEPQDKTKYWVGAAGAAEEIATADQEAQSYILLVQYASLAGQTRKADLAGKKAIELAPKGQKQQAKQAVEQAKAQASQQGAAGAQPAPPPAP